MNSLPTRFFCAMMSMVGTIGLVTFASPAIAVGGNTAKAPATIIAAVSEALPHNG